MKHLDTHALACLDALVTEAHVSRAAHKMGMTQPAMSDTLARLRKVFDDPLLVRTGRGMVPTPRALDAALKARKAIDLVERAISGRDYLSRRDTKLDVRIVAHESVFFRLLPKLMGRLQQEAPDINIIGHTADVRRARELLEADECDIVIGYPPTVSGNLHASLLFTLRLCCIVRIGHPEISGEITLPQYLKYPHVVLGGQPNPVSTIETAVDKYLRSQGFTRKIGARVPGTLLMPGSVAETDCIAIVSESLANLFADRLPLQVLRPPIPLEDARIQMIWHQRTQRDPNHRWLRQHLQMLSKEN